MVHCHRLDQRLGFFVRRGKTFDGEFLQGHVLGCAKGRDRGEPGTSHPRSLERHGHDRQKIGMVWDIPISANTGIGNAFVQQFLTTLVRAMHLFVAQAA